MSKLVPLFEEGADDLERQLLASARSDGPPDGTARARTLAAVQGAVVPVAAASLGGSAVRLGVIKWTAIGLLGVSVAMGSKLVSDMRGDNAWKERVARVAASTVAVPVATTSRAPAAASPPPSWSPASSTPRAAAPIAAVAPVRAESVRPMPLPVVSTQAAPGPQSLGPEPTSAGSFAGGGGGVRPPGPASPSLIKEEAAALEAAREALAASDTTRALTLLDEHDARFPAGALAEDGVVLRVKVLLAAKRDAEARRVVDAFGQVYASSSYLPTLRHMVEGKP